MMNSSVVWLLGFMLVPLYIPMIFIPYWTRKTESFGTTIPENAYYTPEIKKMRRNFAWINAIIAVVISVLFLVSATGQDEKFISFLFPIAVIVNIVVQFLVYIVFHRKMKVLKNNHPEWVQKPQLIIIETGFRSQKLTYSHYWFIIPFLISIVTTLITLINYQKMPDRLPMQYSLSGEVTNWADKSYLSVLRMPIMQIYLTLLLLFINVIISKAKQQISAVNPEESVRQNIIFRRRWSLFTIIMGTGLISLLMLPQLSFLYSINYQWLISTPIIFVIIVFGATIILSIKTGQGGSRVPKLTGADANQVIDRDDDRYWKLGVFYYNKNDPAIFLEKRFGIGWTNNWAHPLSWLIILLIILLAAGLPIVLN